MITPTVIRSKRSFFLSAAVSPRTEVWSSTLRYSTSFSWPYIAFVHKSSVFQVNTLPFPTSFMCSNPGGLCADYSLCSEHSCARQIHEGFLPIFKSSLICPISTRPTGMSRFHTVTAWPLLTQLHLQTPVPGPLLHSSHSTSLVTNCMVYLLPMPSVECLSSAGSRVAPRVGVCFVHDTS